MHQHIRDVISKLSLVPVVGRRADSLAASAVPSDSALGSMRDVVLRDSDGPVFPAVDQKENQIRRVTTESSDKDADCDLDDSLDTSLASRFSSLFSHFASFSCLIAFALIFCYFSFHFGL